MQTARRVVAASGALLFVILSAFAAWSSIETWRLTAHATGGTGSAGLGAVSIGI